MIKTIFLILNYKTYNDTIRLAKDLILNDLKDRKIVIVDNASPNESFNVLSDTFADAENVEVVYNQSNDGYARGNNYGLYYIEKYHPRYVCIINNDVYFNFSVIEKLENLYVSIPNVAFLVPVQYHLDQKPASFVDLKKIPTFWDDLRTTIGIGGTKHIYRNDVEVNDLQEVEIVPGAFLFINYSLFKELGFFYEGTFLFCEERFVAKKVKDNQLHSYILLNEKYIHAHSVTINNEASRRKQRKLLLDGKILYTKCYRKFPAFKAVLLQIASLLYYPLRTIKYVLHKLCGSVMFII